MNEQMHEINKLTKVSKINFLIKYVTTGTERE